MNVNIGELNKKIKIVSKNSIKDESGFKSYDDKTILTTWAKVSNISGTETIKSGADFSVINTRFFIRTPRVSITEDMLVVFRTERYEIKYINDYEYNKQFTEIITQKVVI